MGGGSHPVHGFRVKGWVGGNYVRMGWVSGSSYGVGSSGRGRHVEVGLSRRQLCDRWSIHVRGGVD